MNDLTKEELNVYAMLYVAGVDGQVVESELNFISSSTGEETIKKMIRQFNKESDLEHIEQILYSKKQLLHTEAEVDELIELLKNTFNADDRFSSIERGIMNGLIKLLK